MRESFFTADFFVGNRKRLRELFTGTAPIIITANGRLQRSADTTYPFRQDSNFWYLTGIDQPDLILVMDKNKEYLIVPDKDEIIEMFEGSHDFDQYSARSGIKLVLNQKQGEDELRKRSKKVKHIATLSALPVYLDRHAFYSNPSRSRLHETLQSINPDVEFLDLREHLGRMRMVKQLPELKALNQSIQITTRAVAKVHKRRLQINNEHDAQKIVSNYFESKQVGYAYDPIVASGKNAATLHYIANNQDISKGDLLMLDVGAEVENYSADISRTYATGPITKRQRDVYESVIEVYDYACSLLKPGVTIKSYESLVRLFLGEKLRELGLIKTVDEENIRTYYPQMTSHYLGLDTHDAGDYDRPLVPGVVLTVEPAMYIANEGIGIRVEDDVLITKKGIKNLSANLPRNLE